MISRFRKECQKARRRELRVAVGVLNEFDWSLANNRSEHVTRGCVLLNERHQAYDWLKSSARRRGCLLNYGHINSHSFLCNQSQYVMPVRCVNYESWVESYVQQSVAISCWGRSGERRTRGAGVQVLQAWEHEGARGI